jgi:hypothetical protein
MKNSKMKLEHEFMAVWKQGFHLFHIKTSKSNQNVLIKDKHIHYTFPTVEELNFTAVQ